MVVDKLSRERPSSIRRDSYHRRSVAWGEESWWAMVAGCVKNCSNVLHAVADRLLVYIQSDVIHMFSRSLRACSLNQRHR
jgi:hypothetical protein